MPPLVPAAPFYSILQDSDGNLIAVTNDGGVYKLEAIGKLRNAGGTIVNPATQETLASLEGKDFATQTTLATRASEATLATRLTQATGAAIQAVLEAIRDTAGIKKIVDALPVGDNILGRFKLTDGTNVQTVESTGQAKIVAYARDQGGTLRELELEEDELVTGLYRLAVTGKVSITIPPPPPGGLGQTISADNPLEISQASSPHLTEWEIPDTKTLNIQQIIAGCQGDPSADGSKVEVKFWDGTSEHLIDRIYVVGQTQFGNYPDTDSARDGTALVGNGTSGENTIRIYRSRLSNSSQEIDAVIRGYTI